MNWKPIKTAPKDGRWIVLLTTMGYGGMIAEAARWERDTWRLIDGWHASGSAQYWTEIPSKESIKAALEG